MVNNTLKLKNKNKIVVSLTNNPSQVQYQIYDSKDNLCIDKIGGTPISQTNRTEIMKVISTYLPEGLSIDAVKQKLHHIVGELENEKELEKVAAQQNHELELRKKVHHAEKILKELEDPVMYVGSIIDWLTAGERINTLLCFISGCSQVILKEPISVIGYGESSSGKTHVETVALSLLPEDYIVPEKQVSPAALFNRAKTDPYFYDGKIVVYGDMGGQNDRENQQETFDLMKELQSDGKLSKPISVKDEQGNWITEDLLLIGNPCLWYTTVPTNIDEQELSRAVVFTPRTDNQKIFNTRGKMLSLKVGKTFSKYKQVQEMAKEVPYMVECLRRKMADYTIINPYFEVVTDILMQSKFYKRDTEKYVNILNTITALNYYHNQKYTFEDGSKAIITSKNDVWLFLSLIKPYQTSIALNVKPTSAKIYKELNSKVTNTETLADSLKFGEEEWAEGFTTAEYHQKSQLGLSLRSVQSYFSDLRQAGLLRTTGKKGNNNLYDVNDINFKQTFDNIDYGEISKRVSYEIGEDVAKLIDNDVETEVDILKRHDLVGGTPWKSM